ncbi:small acid-soluble spore protein L (minor) [Lederbergia galactosidilyticus]|uniref:small, acid-soluble spore protein L n=1 Tax=Lederbergia galactosidilytica TaxID=217031 RepID=UPI001AE15ECD|nr:small, acid-soluble spore protein L [Lederbergia galactosidilytica]MBP1915930.1 small acid-soluble spore protein L (minor) [Lederbergia galactosidilytica]
MTREKNIPRKKLHTKNRGRNATSVTPQGYADTEFAQEPKSKLESAAKKKNTK